jgi:hypothetical protein
MLQATRTAFNVDDRHEVTDSYPTIHMQRGSNTAGQSAGLAVKGPPA